MILPFFLGFRDFARAPMTWVLTTLCCLIFLSTYQLSTLSRSPLMEKRTLELTGVLYLQYLDHKELPSPVQLMLLGGKALRDPGFMHEAPTHKFVGDDLEIETWRNHVKKYLEQTEHRSIYQFGLQRTDGQGFHRPLTWITYQFMHADAVHLMGNLLFLILFGVACESIYGGLCVAFVFLVGGVLGGLFSLLVDPATSLPMVGASASISALMGFYLIGEPKQRVRYFYFFSPFPDFFGDIYMSKWWILPLCLLPDLANWISERMWVENELMASNIATSAHIGGALFGMCFAFILRARSRVEPYSPSRNVAP